MSTVASCPSCAAEVSPGAAACPRCRALLAPADDVTRLEPGSAQSGSYRSDQGPTSSSGWLSSSGAIDHGRFQPGSMLGGRYRVIGRLGKGGMGEVYRADDLKLGQPVALKFLPPEVDRDPARLTQLHSEVRMARQVSHPNVCRVYDIDEVDGHTFLSMEYVDGEDLASLLRRIGRFPEDRGLEIARQICAGLHAAHERGVVHRDFKPANVMLDSAGKVRITDFGLAGAAGETIRAGTPAYMAPEQLAGGEVTIRSDIYALGLVLYETFTGHRALDAKNLAELIRRREQSEIAAPSALVRDLSPEIDRAVMRCLSSDPAARPASALAVAAALPGGDPLAAALAAGETPSPEMVAAAGEGSVLSRRAGFALLTFVVVALVAAAVISDRMLAINRVVLDKPVDVLQQRARDILARSGYTAPPADTARGIAATGEYTSWVSQNDRSDTRWQAFEAGHFPIARFWYRTSPRELNPVAPVWSPTINDPPLVISGMATVVLDQQGRLQELVGMPPQVEPSGETAAAFDWAALFDAAGLPLASFTPATPQWTPRAYADARFAWTGVSPHDATMPLRVEAASYRGQPVSFQVIWPWTRPARMEQPARTTAFRLASIGGTILLVSLMAGAIALVRYNLKSGRADRRGASRVALALIGVWVLAWALGAKHALAVDTEMGRFFNFLPIALLNVGTTWMFYLGLEPFVRRLCPDLIISWSRLLAGQVRDSRVARDVLVGLAVGVFLGLVRVALSFTFGWIYGTTPAPQNANMQFFLGARYVASAVLRMIPNALQISMIGTFAYVAFLALVRGRWASAAVSFVLLSMVIIFESGNEGGWVNAVIAVAVFVTPIMFVFLRYGVVALFVALAINQALSAIPLTADLTRPHAAASAWAILFILALAGVAFHFSRAGQGVFKSLVPAR